MKFFSRLKQKSNKTCTNPVSEQTVKLFVPPGHFYSPIVDPGQLNESILTFRSDMDVPGIDLREKAQIDYLFRMKEHFALLPWTDEKQPEWRYHYVNLAFCHADAMVLACTILVHRPKNIIEIGSGYSSAVTLDIIERASGLNVRCQFIEPYPELLRMLLKPGDEERITIYPQIVQDVDLSVYTVLEEGDILFVDSTHIIKTGSDVVHIIQNILPSLKPGVLIHFHDIFFPFEYPSNWVLEDNRSWNEAYYLRAFLTNNRQYEIVFFNHFMAMKNNALLVQAFPGIEKNYGGSLWLRKVG